MCRYNRIINYVYEVETDQQVVWIQLDDDDELPWFAVGSEFRKEILRSYCSAILPLQAVVLEWTNIKLK